MEMIRLNVTRQTEDMSVGLYDQIYDLSVNGIEVQPLVEDIPLPWDAEIYIEEGLFIMDGHIGPGGPSGKGFAKIGIPLDKVKSYLDIYITPNDEEAEAKLRQTLVDYHWL